MLLRAEINTINTANSQIFFNIPIKNSVSSLINSYLDWNFEVLKGADNSRYSDLNDIG